MKVTFTGAGPTTSDSFSPSDPGSHWQTQAWHAYISGTFGAAGSLQVQYSPDPSSVVDASSRWFSPSTLAFTAAGSLWFNARFRKLRFVFTNGDSTTNLVAEVV